jgi:hypothetical protein
MPMRGLFRMITFYHQKLSDTFSEFVRLFRKYKNLRKILCEARHYMDTC